MTDPITRLNAGLEGRYRVEGSVAIQHGRRPFESMPPGGVFLSGGRRSARSWGPTRVREEQQQTRLASLVPLLLRRL